MAGIGVPPKAVSVAIDETPTDEVVAGESDADGPAGQPPVETAGEPAGGVTGHGRRGPLRSIGLRIVAPVALASVALVGLGVMQTGAAIAESRSAERARALARLSSSAAALVHHTELEYAETNALRQRGGTAGAQLLTAARARTDAARARFDRASRVANQTVAAVRPALADAAEALRVLPAARDLAPDSADGSAELFSLYNEIVDELIAVADAVPAQLRDADQVETARSVVLVAELEHLAANQLDLLRRVFNRQRLERGELVTLAGWTGGERQRLAELSRLTGPVKDRVPALLTGPDVERAAGFRDLVLDTDGGTAALRADPDVWYAAQSGLLRRLRILEVDLSSAMEADADRIQTAARTRTIATATLTALMVAGTFAAAIVIAVRTSRRLRRMREAGLALARAELPAAISKVGAAHDAGAVREAVQESSGRIDAAMAAGSDEIGELGDAFSTVHRQALHLAADQALLRMEVEAIFVALSRRGQSLAQRQLHLIDEFGRAESDPQRLGRLYALDHLAARMRRNEENLLVLAGGEPGRRFLAPVPIADAIAAAIEEVEEPVRVRLTGAPGVAVVAHAAGDLIHLLAELLENAITFSPPTTTVRVAARQTVESANITVFDEGIGMPAEKLAEVNRRLAQPSALTSGLVGTMGLLVVARLAQRHGITVRLSSVAGDGTAATVTVPDDLLAPAPLADPLLRGRWRGTVVGPPGRHSEAVAPGRAGPISAAPISAAPVSAAPASAAPVSAAPVSAAPVSAAPVSAAPHVAPPGDGTAPAVSDAPVQLTAAGLPRRVAGATPHRSAGGSPAPAADRPPAAGPPDPETARARLASLASGIAAAQRRAAAAGDPDLLSSPSRGQDHR